MTSSNHPQILITGATGTVGTELAKLLSAQDIPIRLMVRSLAKAGELSRLKGVELVQGDFTDAASLRRAVGGIEKAFLLTNPSADAESLQKGFVEIAAANGVKHIVKLSQLKAEEDSPVRFLRYHAAIEASIKEVGMDYTFLRPNLFMQGLLSFGGLIASQGKFFASAGKATVSLIDARDIATVAAAVLTGKGHEGKTYDLTGPAGLSHDELATIFSMVLNRTINYVDLPPAQFRDAILVAGFPEWQAEGLVEDYAHYARGEASAVSSTVEEITGKTPRSFELFVRDHVAAFKA